MYDQEDTIIPAGEGFISRDFADCPAWLLDRARMQGAMPLLVVRASSSLPMQSAFEAHKAGIATPIFVGEDEDIKAEAETLGWDISGFELIPAEGEADSAMRAATRLKEGLSGQKSPIGAVMKGQLHTDIFMSALMDESIGLRGKKRLVHVFVIFPKDSRRRPVLVSDAAVNISPDRKTQHRSMVEMCYLSRLLGQERPRLAILSATETRLPQMPSTATARAHEDWAREMIYDIDVSGPLPLDLALSPESVRIKDLEADPVAGFADCFLAPEIVSGNILYKSFVYFGGGCAAGIVLGGAVPLLLTSRSDPPQARLSSIALAAVVAEDQA